MSVTVTVVRWCGKYRAGDVVIGAEAERLQRLYPWALAKEEAEAEEGRETEDAPEEPAGYAAEAYATDAGGGLNG